MPFSRGFRFHSSLNFVLIVSMMAIFCCVVASAESLPEKNRLIDAVKLNSTKKSVKDRTTEFISAVYFIFVDADKLNSTKGSFKARTFEFVSAGFLIFVGATCLVGVIYVLCDALVKELRTYKRLKNDEDTVELSEKSTRTGTA